jgi:hypothetical protein
MIKKANKKRIIAVKFGQNSGETVGGRIQNLKPWPKGVSGNPSGRPKNDISLEIARAVFEHNPEAIYRAMTRALCKGDARIFKVLADRAYGKVKEQVSEDVPPSLSDRLAAARRRSIETLSDEELTERINQLQRELLLRPSVEVGLQSSNLLPSESAENNAKK